MRSIVKVMFACLMTAACREPSVQKAADSNSAKAASTKSANDGHYPAPDVEESYAAYRVGGEVKPPVIFSRPEPKIPPHTPCRGLVQFRSVVDEHGNVTHIQDLSPHRDAFSWAYQLALQQTKFRPGTLRGKPVSVEYVMSVNIRCE